MAPSDFTVSTNAAFAPLKDAAGNFTGYAPGSGDYNADGDNFDFPDVASYKYSTSRKSYLNGLFPSGTFNAPGTFGAEGNETYNSFRQPGFAQWDTALLKNTAITERVNFQLRFEFFNVTNYVNFSNPSSGLNVSTFGTILGAGNPRILQFAAKYVF